MEMYHKIVFLVLTAPVACLGATDVMFRHCALENKANITAALDSALAYSTLECGRNCARNKQCLTAVYDVNQNQCLLSDAQFTDTECQTVNKGETALHVLKREISEKCKNGGTWNDTLEACQNCLHMSFGKYCDEYVRDCKHAYDAFPEKRSPVAVAMQIKPQSSKNPFFVKCLLSWGGVTYVARRWHNASPSANFNGGWADFKKGFGDFNSEYFIGLENLHLLTKQRVYRFEIYMIPLSGADGAATYFDFNIDDEANDFKLRYSSYDLTSPMGDGFGFGTPTTVVKNSPFCTFDHDCGNCAQSSQSGWWFNTACSEVNLHAPHGGDKYISWPSNDAMGNISYYDFQLI